jgi:hypothetical protein
MSGLASFGKLGYASEGRRDVSGGAVKYRSPFPDEEDEAFPRTLSMSTAKSASIS